MAPQRFGSILTFPRLTNPIKSTQNERRHILIEDRSKVSATRPYVALSGVTSAYYSCIGIAKHCE
jgi:hypothetical protein